MGWKEEPFLSDGDEGEGEEEAEVDGTNDDRFRPLPALTLAAIMVGDIVIGDEVYERIRSMLGRFWSRAMPCLMPRRMSELPVRGKCSEAKVVVRYVRDSTSEMTWR